MTTSYTYGIPIKVKCAQLTIHMAFNSRKQSYNKKLYYWLAYLKIDLI